MNSHPCNDLKLMSLCIWKWGLVVTQLLTAQKYVTNFSVPDNEEFFQFGIFHATARDINGIRIQSPRDLVKITSVAKW